MLFKAHILEFAINLDNILIQMFLAVADADLEIKNLHKKYH